MYINRLKNLIASNGKTYVEAAKAIGMSESGFHAAARKDTFKAKDIINLADWLGVPLTLIYQDEIESFKSISEDYKKFNNTRISYSDDPDPKSLLIKLTKSIEELTKRVESIERQKN